MVYGRVGLRGRPRGDDPHLRFLVARTRSALDGAENSVHMQAWQLRQLVPHAARTATEASSPTSVRGCIAAPSQAGLGGSE
jgi:hypothetical protein